MSTRGGPLFNFYDVVQIVTVDPVVQPIDRLFGAVLGLSQNEDGSWGYAVSVFRDPACLDWTDGWDIHERNLVKTGRAVPPEHIYGGDMIRVRGDGQIMEE